MTNNILFTEINLGAGSIFLIIAPVFVVGKGKKKKFTLWPQLFCLAYCVDLCYNELL